MGGDKKGIPTQHEHEQLKPKGIALDSKHSNPMEGAVVLQKQLNPSIASAPPLEKENNKDRTLNSHLPQSDDLQDRSSRQYACLYAVDPKGTKKLERAEL